jgi:hypothetical protein
MPVTLTVRVKAYNPYPTAPSSGLALMKAPIGMTYHSQKPRRVLAPKPMAAP